VLLLKAVEDAAIGHRAVVARQRRGRFLSNLELAIIALIPLAEAPGPAALVSDPGSLYRRDTADGYR